jgi:hypothetical protein
MQHLHQPSRDISGRIATAEARVRRQLAHILVLLLAGHDTSAAVDPLRLLMEAVATMQDAQSISALGHKA